MQARKMLQFKFDLKELPTEFKLHYKYLHISHYQGIFANGLKISFLKSDIQILNLMLLVFILPFKL